jgi:hypothetical protein
MSTDPDDHSTSDPVEPGVPGEGNPTAAGPAADPVSRWATEHYGFEDEEEAAVPGTAPSAPTAAPVISGRRPQALLAGAVLALLVTSGIGGAAIAADGDNGPRNRANDTVQVDRGDGFRGEGAAGLGRGGDGGRR